MGYMFRVGIVLFLIVPVVVQAFAPQFTENEIPYAATRLTIEQGVRHDRVGELTGFPDTYEWRLVATTSLRLTLRGLAEVEPTDLRGILVRQLPQGGVREIVRVGTGVSVVTDDLTRLQMTQTIATVDLGPGSYRFEVSNPENRGFYWLTISAGQSHAESIWAVKTEVQQLYEFFEVSTWRWWTNPSVYQPIGIVILLGLIYGTWRYMRRRNTP